MSSSGPRRGGMGDTIESAAGRLGDHPALETAARVGYAVNGVLHLVIAWICLQLAMLRPTGDADQSGALRSLSTTTMGTVALWLGVVGFVGLCLWQVTEVLVPGLYGDDWGARVKDASKAVVYGVLAWSCFTFASGGSSSGKGQTRDVTAHLMGAFAGRLLVGVVALVIVGVGVYHVIKGVRRRFLRDLEDDPGELAVWAGTIGYPTRGLAIGTVGLLFLLAAVRDSTARADGLDGAFHFLLQQPYGRLLVGLMAVGFAAFGVYLFFRARHARV